MDINEAVLKERAKRKQQAIDRFAELVVSTEYEMGVLQEKIKKMQQSNEVIPNFEDQLVVEDYLRRFGLPT